MSKFYAYIVVIIGLTSACTSSRHTVSSSTASPVAASPLIPVIESVRLGYAPDKRTALFDITANGNVLTGETNLPEAKAVLIQRVTHAGMTCIDSIRLLPDTSLGANTTAIVSISVANLRAKPGHVNEMVTQATMGTPLKVFKKDKGWYLVQTPDKYIAWTEGGGIRLLTPANSTSWRTAEKVIYTRPYGFAYAEENTNSQTVSDLVYGDVLALQGEKNGFYKVGFPDGRTAYIPSPEIIPYKEWTSSRNPTRDSLVSASKRLMGIPYLWGGTSFKGVDCSGFTRTVYFMNGLILPRDASQQVNIGQEVDTHNGWQNLQAGDLLFFGTPAHDGRPEHIVHVGMWLGGPNNEFIQSASRVQISSFNPDAPNYDGLEARRFVRAKRVTPSDVLYDLRSASYF